MLCAAITGYMFVCSQKYSNVVQPCNCCIACIFSDAGSAAQHCRGIAMLQTITPPMPATFFVSIEKFCKKLRTSEHCCCRTASLQVDSHKQLCVFMFVKKRTSEQKHEHCRSAAVRRKTHRSRTLRTRQHCCLCFVVRVIISQTPVGHLCKQHKPQFPSL